MVDYVESPPDDDPPVEVPDGTDGPFEIIAAISAAVAGSNGAFPGPTAPTDEIKALANFFDGLEPLPFANTDVSPVPVTVTRDDLNTPFEYGEDLSCAESMARCAAINEIQVNSETQQVLNANAERAAERDSAVVIASLTEIGGNVHPAYFERYWAWTIEFKNNLDLFAADGTNQYARTLLARVSVTLDNTMAELAARTYTAVEEPGYGTQIVNTVQIRAGYANASLPIEIIPTTFATGSARGGTPIKVYTTPQGGEVQTITLNVDTRIADRLKSPGAFHGTGDVGLWTPEAERMAFTALQDEFGQSIIDSTDSGSLAKAAVAHGLLVAANERLGSNADPGVLLGFMAQALQESESPSVANIDARNINGYAAGASDLFNITQLVRPGREVPRNFLAPVAAAEGRPQSDTKSYPVLLKEAAEKPLFDETKWIDVYGAMQELPKESNLVRNFLKAEANRREKAMEGNQNPYFDPWAEPMTKADMNAAIGVLQQIRALPVTSDQELTRKQNLLARATAQISAHVMKTLATRGSDYDIQGLNHLLTTPRARYYRDVQGDFIQLLDNGNTTWLDFRAPLSISETSNANGPPASFTDVLFSPFEWVNGALQNLRDEPKNILVDAKNADILLVKVLNETEPLSRSQDQTGECTALLNNLDPATDVDKTYPTFFSDPDTYILHKFGNFIASANPQWTRNGDNIERTSSPELAQQWTVFRERPGQGQCVAFNQTQTTLARVKYDWTLSPGACQALTPVDAFGENQLARQLGIGLDETGRTLDNLPGGLSIWVAVAVLMRMITWANSGIGRKLRLPDAAVTPLVFTVVGGLAYVSNGLNGIAVPTDLSEESLRQLFISIKNLVVNTDVSNPVGLALAAKEILGTLVQPKLTPVTGLLSFAGLSGIGFILETLSGRSLANQLMVLFAVLTNAATMGFKPAERLEIKRSYDNGGVAIGTLHAKIDRMSRMCVQDAGVWATVAAMVLSLVQAVPEKLLTLQGVTTHSKATGPIAAAILATAYGAAFKLAPALVAENERRNAYLTMCEVLAKFKKGGPSGRLGLSGALSSNDIKSLEALRWEGLSPETTLRILNALKSNVDFVYVGEGQREPSFTYGDSVPIRVTVRGNGEAATIDLDVDDIGKNLMIDARNAVYKLDTRKLELTVDETLKLAQSSAELLAKFSTRALAQSLLTTGNVGLGAAGILPRVVGAIDAAWVERESIEIVNKFLENFPWQSIVVAPVFLLTFSSQYGPRVDETFVGTVGAPTPSRPLGPSPASRVTFDYYKEQRPDYYTPKLSNDRKFRPPDIAAGAEPPLFIWTDLRQQAVVNVKHDDPTGQEADLKFAKLRSMKNVISVENLNGKITPERLKTAIEAWKQEDPKHAKDFMSKRALGKTEVRINAYAVEEANRNAVAVAAENALTLGVLAGAVDRVTTLPNVRPLDWRSASVGAGSAALVGAAAVFLGNWSLS